MIKELHRMAIFANVVEQGSFSKAAANLGLGKSIISAHVSALEKRLGIKLINRSTRASGSGSLLSSARMRSK